MEMLGKWRFWRHRQKSKEPVQLFWRVRDQVAIPTHHVCRPLEWPERRPSRDTLHLVQPEEERRNYAKIPASAPNRPKQVWIFVRIGSHQAAICQDNIRFQKIIDSEPEAAHQVSQAPAQR